MASPPASRISRATSRPASSVRPVTTTLAPSRAKRTAIARPMPRVDPVTSATLSSSRTSDLVDGGTDPGRDLVEHREIEAIDARGVLPEDGADLAFRRSVQRLVDHVAAVRPTALVVRVVGTPEHVVDTDPVAELRLRRPEEHGLHVALALPVLARLRLQPLLLVLEHAVEHVVHHLQRVGNPIRPLLREAHLQVGV